MIEETANSYSEYMKVDIDKKVGIYLFTYPHMQLHMYTTFLAVAD